MEVVSTISTPWNITWKQEDRSWRTSLRRMNTASPFPPFLGLDVLISPLLHFLLILKTHSQGLEPSCHNPILLSTGFFGMEWLAQSLRIYDDEFCGCFCGIQHHISQIFVNLLKFWWDYWYLILFLLWHWWLVLEHM